MYVWVFSVTVNSAERGSFRKGLFEELICEVSNLRIGGRDVERQDEPVMSPSALRLFKLLHGAEMRAQPRRLFREPNATVSRVYACGHFVMELDIALGKALENAR